MNVEYSDGATQAGDGAKPTAEVTRPDLVRPANPLMRALVGSSVPVAPEGARVLRMPSATGYMARNLRENAPSLLSTAAAASIPGGWAARLLGSEAGYDLGQAITGKSITPGVGATSQAFGEALGMPLRLATNARVLGATRKAAQAIYEQAVKRREEWEKFKTALHGALSSITDATNRTMQEEHVGATRDWAVRGAESIAGAWKKAVPPWAKYPGGERGLDEMVFGQGQSDLSRWYDPYMKDIISAGKGLAVEIPLADAKALGVKVQGRVVERERGRPIATVDGGQLAEAALGFWKKDHGVYRRTVSALDARGLGDPAARGVYRAAQALQEFARGSKMLTPEGEFDPFAVRAGLRTGNVRGALVDALRKRGVGDARRGPIASAVERPPVARQMLRPPVPPAPAPEVPKPPETPPGFRTRTLPTIKHPYLAGVAAELPFSLAGHHLYGSPFAVGSLIAGGISGRELVTRAPLSPEAEALLRLFPSLAAGLARPGFEQARDLTR